MGAAGRVPQLDGQTAAGLRRWGAKTAGVIALLALALFGSAGTLRWSGGWLYLLLVVATQGLMAALLLPRDPQLLAERSRVGAGAKPWDVPLAMGMAVVGPLGMAIIGGLDFRYDWIGYVPPGMVAGYFGLAVLGSLITVAAMAANSFFSGVLRIQSEREHRVVTAGPYAVIRHPGYLGAILVTVATPYLLGSRWATFAAWPIVALIVLRTWLEDRTLRAELPGYEEYAARVGYRLVPGLW